MSGEDDGEDFTFGEQDTDVSERSVAFIPGKRGIQNETDVPIANAETVPLFPTAKSKEKNLGININVTKLDPPGNGYKGVIPASSTMEHIANKYGDGSYSLELMNAKGVVLRKRDYVKISAGIEPESERKAAANTENHGELSTLVTQLVGMLQASSNKDDANAKNLIDRGMQLAKQHSDMVTESAKASATRDHDYHRLVSQETREFFKAILESSNRSHEQMLTQVNAIHAQAMASSEQRHQHMMEMMMAMGERERMMSDPKLLLGVLKQGMELAGNGASDDEGWEKAGKLAIGGLRELRGLAEVASTHATKSKALVIASRRRALPKTQETAITEEKPVVNQDNRPRVLRRRRRDNTGSGAQSVSEAKDTEGDDGLG